ALEGADVVMALRLQLERMRANYLPSLREYTRLYCITRERLGLAKPDVLLMHPGPVNRGVELAADLVENAPSAVEEQVTNGVAVRMALLYLMLGGE
ncbi:MAG: aspartate carbamoyltransferase, partial [Firmicutes bacterium]|nr:aspartate carbamoyltransferase [Bacillota bacterium]